MFIWLLIFVGLTFAIDFLFISSPSYRGDKTNRFDGKKFRNDIFYNKKFIDVLGFMLSMPFKKQKWPNWIENKKFPIPIERSQKPVFTFINQSTFLIQINNLNILTDPVFSDRVSPFSFMGPKRVRAPGIALNDLPPIDLILVSHNHYDHMDKKSLISLYNSGSKRPNIFGPLGTNLLLKKWGIQSTDFDWGDKKEFNGLELYFEPCQHWAGRGSFDRMRSLWGAFVIKHNNFKIYFAGDTGYGDHFKNTFNQLGSIDVALLPIGAYEPRWFMSSQHMNPFDAVKAHLDLQSKVSIGMHYGTFQLTYEAIDAPVAELSEAKSKKSINDHSFITLDFGEFFRLE